jgi:hypothetical protein
MSKPKKKVYRPRRTRWTWWMADHEAWLGSNTVRQMTLAEEGIYGRLLHLYASNGGWIPNDFKKLFKMFGKPNSWRALKNFCNKYIASLSANAVQVTCNLFVVCTADARHLQNQNFHKFNPSYKLPENAESQREAEKPDPSDTSHTLGVVIPSRPSEGAYAPSSGTATGKQIYGEKMPRKMWGKEDPRKYGDVCGDPQCPRCHGEGSYFPTGNCECIANKLKDPDWLRKWEGYI